MKILAVYAICTDGTRDLLWLRKLPANFDWQAWADSRQGAMRVLGVRQFHRGDRMKMIRLALVFLFMTFTLHASDFAVKLEDVQKVQDRVYTGTAGKSQITVYTEECFHETTKGEWASFTWYGSDGMIAFSSNADLCHVKSYKSAKEEK